MYIQKINVSFICFVHVGVSFIMCACMFGVGVIGDSVKSVFVLCVCVLWCGVLGCMWCPSIRGGGEW